MVYLIGGIGGEGRTAGGLVGFNYRLSHALVVGVQGDVGSTGLNIPALGGNLVDAQPDFTASASVRLGYGFESSRLRTVMSCQAMIRWS
jgi:hypothetical protein